MDTSKYWEFHQDYVHETNACRELKNQIEEAVKSGKLAHLVKKSGKGKPSKQTLNLENGPHQRAPSIDLILISVQVYKRQVGRVLLDGRAACDIIYEHCFLNLEKEISERKRDVYTTLFGFSSEQVISLGEISLPIMVGEHPHHMSE
uniref:Reverse transcriptase domain-containing protein n=1 Tax=Tanacetum cinerariifolium TaxID=118510 RepID=A0A6L2NMZ3_TANCI|nr:hypothetical protein [Tanacetum cinerariifolium]